MTIIKNCLSKFFSTISLIILIVALSGSCNEDKSLPLIVDIGTDGNSKLNFSISNNGSSDLLFFDYDTPVKGHFRQYFKITNEYDEVVPYIGRVAFVDLESSNWTQLRSGEVIKFSIDLYQEYDFSPESGTYNITYASPINIKMGNFSTERSSSEEKDFSSTLDSEKIILESNEIQVEIDNTYNPDLRQMRDTRACSGSQLSVINSSSNLGGQMARKCINYMNAYGMNNLWNTWWGVDNQSRYDFIMNGFNKISDSFKTSWTYNCPSSSECSSRAIIAWVYKNRPHTVWLCPGWFNFSEAGFRGSVLIHEASHWTITVDTDDFGYGESFCKSLAKSNPENAKRNADNYDYFSYYVYKSTDSIILSPGTGSKDSVGCGSGVLAPDL